MNSSSSVGLSATSRKPKTARIDDGLYEPYKQTIRELYLVEDGSIEDVMDILKLTKAQCKRLVNDVWGFRKRLTAADHEYIGHMKRKREKGGKLSTRVKLGGVRKKDDEVIRKNKRRHTSTFDRLQKQKTTMMPPKTPNCPLGLEVGTPTPRNVLRTPNEISPASASTSRQVWVSTPNDANNINSPIQSRMVGSPRFNLRPSILYRGLPSLEFEKIFIRMIAKTRGDPTPTSPNYSPSNLSLSKMSHILSFHKPAAHIKSLLSATDTFFSVEELGEILQSLVISLANDGTKDARSSRRLLDDFTSSEIPRRHPNILRSFFGEDNPVINEFAVQALYSASRIGELGLIKILIEHGILSSSRHSRWREHSSVIGASALQFAIEYRQGAAISLLLENKIHLNVQPVSDLSQSLLKTAVEVEDPDLVEQLLELGAEDVVFKEGYDRDLRKSRYRKELVDEGLLWANKFWGPENENPELLLTALHTAIYLGSNESIYLLLSDRTRRYEYRKESNPYDSMAHYVAVAFHSVCLEHVLDCTALGIDINGISIDGTTALDITNDSSVFDLLRKHGAIPSGPTDTMPNRTSRRELIGSFDLPEAKAELCKTLDHLRALAPDFPWSSYKQSLDCCLFLSASAELYIESSHFSSDSYAKSVNFSLELRFRHPENIENLKEIEMAGGDLYHQTIEELEGIVYIDLEFISNDETLLDQLCNQSRRINTTTQDNDEDLNIDWELLGEWETEVLCGRTESILEFVAIDVSEGDTEVTTFTELINNWHQLPDSINGNFFEKIISLYMPYFDQMSCDQLASLLRAAMRLNQHEAIKLILSSREADLINRMVVLTAFWYGDSETFFRIADLAKQLYLKPEYLAMISIINGHAYKLIWLLDEKKLGADSALDTGKSLIEVAVELGRIDMAQILLNSGASHRLAEAKAQAATAGHFALATMIAEHITGIQNADMSPPSHIGFPSPLPAGFANSSQPAQKTPSQQHQSERESEADQEEPPVSPRLPLVHELDIYVPNHVFEEIFSEGQLGIQPTWHVPTDQDNQTDFEYS